MKLSFAVMSGLLGGISICPATVSAQTFVCVPSTTPIAAPLKNAIDSVVVSTDTGARTRFHLPALPVNEVVVVTTVEVCRAAGRAFERGYPSDVRPGWTYRLVVLRVGDDRYVVMEPDYNPGGRSLAMVFDGHWKLLAELVE